RSAILALSMVSFARTPVCTSSPALFDRTSARPSSARRLPSRLLPSPVISSRISASRRPNRPATLVARLSLAERHHHVLVVRTPHIGVGRVPRAAPRAVPLPLAFGGPTGRLTITNSWV